MAWSSARRARRTVAAPGGTPSVDRPDPHSRSPKRTRARRSLDPPWPSAEGSPVEPWSQGPNAAVTAPSPERRLGVWADPVTPDLGGPEEDWTRGCWWWLGVHGGAGVSTLAVMVPGGADAVRRWPDPAKGGPAPVVLVARAHAQGMARARAAARQWATSGVPAGLRLAGLVVVAAAPGRLPAHLADQVRLLRATVPAVWPVPWMPELLDLPDPAGANIPPALYPLTRDLTALRGGTPS